MYKYAATDSIFDGVSNIYLISIATAFLAVVIAFYCSNFLKDESEKQLPEAVDKEDSVNDTTTEIENHYQLKQELKLKGLKIGKPENNSGNEDDDDDDYIKSNSTNDISDDYDSDDIQVDGLVSKLKTKRLKELEAQLTRDQLEEERRIEREQLAAIFELIKKQEAELNMKEIDESELNAQLGLYR